MIWNKYQPNIKIVNSVKSLAEFTQWMGEKLSNPGAWFALDTETTGLKPHNSKILLLQIGDTTAQWVLDIAKIKNLVQFKTVLNYLNLPDAGWVAHNMKFDWGMIKTNFGIELNKIVCTYIANELLTKGNKLASSGLEECVDKYLGIKLDKREQSSFETMEYGQEFTESQLIYAAMDTVYLLPLWEELKKRLIEKHLTSVALLEFESIKPTAELEINGIYINQKLWLNLKEDAEAKRQEVIKQLDKIVLPYTKQNLFGDPILNYNSPIQVKPIFEQILGHALESTDAKYLENFKDDHPVIECYLEYKKQTKLVTTYGVEFLQKYVDPVTQRIHPSFKQLGADTGRMACRDPNLQNIPKLQIYRDPFEAQDPDWRIISADFSNQEIRLLIQISQEPALIKALKEKKDIHSFSASLLFNIPYEDFLVYDENKNILYDEEGEPIIKKEMKIKYRNPAKSITFGLIYGMGVTKLANTLGISIEEAKSLKNKYFEVFPKIKELMDKLAEDAKAKKYAYSPLDGRRRDLSYIDWDHPKQVAGAMNQAKNFPFQGCGASTTKKAMVLIRNEIKRFGLKAKIINVIHDELLYEVHKDHAKQLAKIVQNKMIQAFNTYAPDVLMVVKPEISTKWIH